MTAPLTVKTPPSVARLAPSLSRVLWLFQPPIVHVMDPAVAMTAPLTVKTPHSAARLARFTVEGSVVVPALNSVMDPAVAMTAPLTVKTPPSAV